MRKVKSNDTILVHYVGKYDNGEVFDTTPKDNPARFQLGAGKLIKGFEKGFLGLEVGEKKTLKVPFQDAYGPINEKLFHKIHKSDLPGSIDLKIGAALVAKNAEGKEHHVFIKSIEEMYIIVDANHPLAGKDLIFDIELVDIVDVVSSK